MEAQSFSVKRAEVEFHSFASFGEPERAIATYAEENVRRGAVIRNHLNFLQWMTPYLEIGANAGHSSYMMENEFGAEGFALDLSADALRHGQILMDRWGLDKAPVRLAGDALHLPFADNSLRLVMAYQMLSQFQDIEAVFVEAKRVLQPGGVFLFAEEPIRRLLTLRLYRAPYWEQMQWWERKLHESGLLGFFTKDVIGAHQEESFGIRQNHRMTLWDWDRLIRKHFVDHEYELFVPQRGWGERVAYQLAQRIDKHRSRWVPARMLGGTMAAVCRKEGFTEYPGELPPLATRFEELLRCPDCGKSLNRNESDTLQCVACGYAAHNEGGVYNLLKSEDRRELYPGLRGDVIDFCQGPCEERLMAGFYQVEGVFGNKYRWINDRAAFRLERVRPGPLKVRIRGHAPEKFRGGRLAVKANGSPVGVFTIERQGLFIVEAPLAGEAPAYEIELQAGPSYQMPPDERWFTVNLSHMRLVN